MIWRGNATAIDRQAEFESIAVLPLENRSGNPAEEYFVAGIHEGLITDLARIGLAKVIAKSSADAFKGTKKSAAGHRPRAGRRAAGDRFSDSCGQSNPGLGTTRRSGHRHGGMGKQVRTQRRRRPVAPERCRGCDRQGSASQPDPRTSCAAGNGAASKPRSPRRPSQRKKPARRVHEFGLRLEAVRRRGGTVRRGHPHRSDVRAAARRIEPHISDSESDQHSSTQERVSEAPEQPP